MNVLFLFVAKITLNARNHGDGWMILLIFLAQLFWDAANYIQANIWFTFIITFENNQFLLRLFLFIVLHLSAGTRKYRLILKGSVTSVVLCQVYKEFILFFLESRTIRKLSAAWETVFRHYTSFIGLYLFSFPHPLMSIQGHVEGLKPN